MNCRRPPSSFTRVIVRQVDGVLDDAPVAQIGPVAGFPGEAQRQRTTTTTSPALKANLM